MNAQKRPEIYSRQRDHNPTPTTELHWQTPFELLTAVLLSAQATDVGVNKATARLFPVANTPQGILDLGLEGLKDKIKTIGLYNSKADNLMKTCHLLLERHRDDLGLLEEFDEPFAAGQLVAGRFVEVAGEL